MPISAYYPGLVSLIIVSSNRLRSCICVYRAIRWQMKPFRSDWSAVVEL